MVNPRHKGVRGVMVAYPTSPSYDYDINTTWCADRIGSESTHTECDHNVALIIGEQGEPSYRRQYKILFNVRQMTFDLELMRMLTSIMVMTFAFEDDKFTDQCCSLEAAMYVCCLCDRQGLTV